MIPAHVLDLLNQAFSAVQPTVRVERNVCDDKVDKERHGTEIGTSYFSGPCEIYLDDQRRYEPACYVLRTVDPFDIGDMYNALPHLLLLLADRRVQAEAPPPIPCPEDIDPNDWATWPGKVRKAWWRMSPEARQEARKMEALLGQMDDDTLEVALEVLDVLVEG